MTLHHRSENCGLVGRPFSVSHWRAPSKSEAAAYPSARRTHPTRLCALSETQGFHQQEAFFHVYGGPRKPLKRVAVRSASDQEEQYHHNARAKVQKANMASRS